MRLISTIGSARHHDAEFAGFDRGPRVRHVEGAAQAHGPNEASELTFDQVKGRIDRARRRSLLARHDQHVASKEDGNRLRGYARDIDKDLDGVPGINHIERWGVLARVRAPVAPLLRSQPGEDDTKIVLELARLGREVRKIRHERP